MNLYENIKKNLKESVKVGPIYRIGPEEYITSYNDIRLDGVNTTLEDIELFKRVDWSDTAPDKVNYLLVANMRWDVDPSVSVPVLYNISEDEYEDEINPALLGVFDEDLDLEIYNAVDEAIKNLALEISMSGRINESEEEKEPIGWEVKYLQEVYPGEFTSVRVGVYNTPEKASEKVFELQSQGFNASYDVLWEEEEDPNYDKYADDTNWAAEEEADAIERMERRYGQGQE